MTPDQKVAGVLYTFKLEDGTFADLFVPGALGTVRAEEPGTAFSFKVQDGTVKTVFIPGASKSAYLKGIGPIEGPAAGLLHFYTDNTPLDPDELEPALSMIEVEDAFSDED